ncbi:hypothetical protein MUN84_05565 [Hymenobacter sp. 5516J-16]|uniref:hypothetical protein n=1 Tax=Hymenobacter sp. 5516J-16 TaxID=2932253 RepID=UPI001FD4953B|nr:hypothetical protein [Hymenobacter sp. 5516J-16]UOQ78079.1 hypothetical protein MUN84_05565 [Hymenobacter sp. 5516J-16]
MSLSFVPRLRALPRLLLSTAALGLLLTGCNSNPNTSTAHTTTAKSPVAAGSAEPTDSPGTWYRQYRGVLPGSSDSITLHLQCLPESLGRPRPVDLSAFIPPPMDARMRL